MATVPAGFDAATEPRTVISVGRAALHPEPASGRAAGTEGTGPELVTTEQNDGNAYPVYCYVTHRG
jgi:hypothetical protein